VGRRASSTGIRQLAVVLCVLVMGLLLGSAALAAAREQSWGGVALSGGLLLGLVVVAAVSWRQSRGA
jgi:hypothetical protein